MSQIKIGWASRDVSTDKPINLPGQFHMRISKGIMDPVTANTLVLDDGEDQVIFLSCDLVVCRSHLVDIIREKLEHNPNPSQYELDETKEAVMGLLKERIRPEFLNRIDEIIMFQPLNKSQIRDIVRIQLRMVAKMLEKNDITITATDEAVNRLADVGYDPAMGARPVKRVIQREILNEMSRQLLEGKIHTDETVIIDVIDGQFVFYNPKKAQ